MPVFPYFGILKKAFELTRRNFWLWGFGLFIGGITGLNFSGLNFFSPYRFEERLQHWHQGWFILQSWMIRNSAAFAVIVLAASLLSLVLIVLFGLSKGAVIWAADRLDPPSRTSSAVAKPLPTFRQALKNGGKYLWPIIGLEAIVTFGLAVLFLVFAAPIIYLFIIQSIGRAVILLLLGFLIMIPASLVFGFLHLYGPIFIVLYDLPIGEALHYSFNLIWQKLWETVILAAFLVGLNLLFMLVLVFCIIILLLPVSLLAWLLIQLGFTTAFFALVVTTLAAVILFVLTLLAGFAVFHNIVWVLAVREMVKTKRAPEIAEAWAGEPVI